MSKVIINTETRIKQETGYDYLIGRYDEDDQGNGFFTDLRGPEGDIFTSEDLEVQDVEYTDKNLRKNVFYKFHWQVINEDPIRLAVVGDVEDIDKNKFLTVLYEATAKTSGRNREMFINHQKSLLVEVTGDDHTYIYELLQNANDYPSAQENNIVKVKFVVTPKYLLFLHTGEEFNLKNITAICTVNQGEKKYNTKTIGYKGIGFKTVFVNNNYVFLKSGDWCLRFDEEYVENQYGRRPWIVMPIPTDISTVDEELKDALHQYGDKYRVFFALRHKSNDASKNVPLLEKVFTDNQILLFIPNVYDVSVSVLGQEKYHVTKEKDKWVTSQFEWTIPQELHEWVEEDSKKGGKVPPKFKEIESIGISFAVERNGNSIIPVEDARVYNYLPTELRLGFKFLINADFVPNGSRSNLHPTHWNDEVMQQCGRYFVNWWSNFFAKEGEWDPNSVFSIIPEFNSSEPYSKQFKLGFDRAMLELPCIPTLYKGQYQLTKISDVIWDDLGFTSGDHPMFTDDEFYQFVQTIGRLPIPSIRENKVLKQLLSERFKGKCHMFTGNSLNQLVNNDRFCQWLKVRENNIKFNRFLLEKNWMMNLKSSNILLSSQGTLTRFDKLYLDIDEYIERLPLLSDSILYIDSDVRDALKDIREWNNYLGDFKRFSPSLFANEIVEIYKSNPAIFDDIDNNVGFIRVLAGLEVRYDKYVPNNFRFITTKDRKADANQALFRKTDFGEQFVQQPWVKEDWVAFISERYFENDKEKVERFLDPTTIQPINVNTIYHKFLYPEETSKHIAEIIKKPELNIAFYRYLALTVKMDPSSLKFDPKMKTRYTLMVTDGHNQLNVLMSQQIFLHSEEWEDTIQKSWMPSSICLALSSYYTDGLSDDDNKRMTAFFQSPQIVNPLTIGTLTNLVKVQKNLQLICENIKDKESSKDFLEFLYVNKQRMFKDENPTSLYQKIPILLENKEQVEAISDIHGSCYFPSEDLETVLQQEWSKSLKINICSDFYDDLFSSNDRKAFFEQLGIHRFDLVAFIRKNVIFNTENFEEQITEKSANLNFHKFLYKVHKRFSGEDTEKFKKFPIYISSPQNEEGELASSARNHYLPSKLLTEIIHLDIVPISILDCIHPDYVHSLEERSYYSDILENTEIDKEGFVNYITSNGNIQEVTEYLRDRERNIRFWRWVYDAKLEYNINEKLRVLPMMGHKEGVFAEEFISPQNLFISNAYSDNLNLESLIAEFTNEPYFVCADYKEGNDGRNWNQLFHPLHVTTDTHEIVFRHILPNLSKYQRTDIVELIAEHEGEISERLKKDDSILKKQLSAIQLKCTDGIYRKPADALLTGKYFDIEKNPFPEVKLDHLIDESYITREGISPEVSRRVRRLLVVIADSYEDRCESLTSLRNKKITKYLQEQTTYTEDAHLNIVAQLAKCYSTDSEGINVLLRGKNVFLYDTQGRLCKSNDLYMSSAYHPDCDFMANGIGNKDYVSEKYLEYADLDLLKRFFYSLYVWSSFCESDLKWLENPQFSRYFWQDYAPKKENQLRNICTEEKLRDIKCIPSPTGNKRPGDLSDYRKEQLQKIVLALPNGGHKLPNVNLPKWIDKIGLRNTLYIPDCLEYLKLNNVNFRKNILGWITESDYTVIHRYVHEINDYIASADWLNGHKRWVPLSSLVALEWGNNTLKGNFSNNAFVCNPSYMPEYQNDYKKLCDIFKIKIINNNDFTKVKSGKWDYDDVAKSEIQKRLLYISFKTGKDNWVELYKQRKQQLLGCEICTCSKIAYQYNENISADLLSYTEEDNKLWYVGTWNGPMFIDILDWVKRVFKISGVDDSLLKNLFFSPFNTFLRNHEHDLPKEFLDLLSESDRQGLLEDNEEKPEEYIEDVDASVDLPDDLNHAGENVDAYKSNESVQDQFEKGENTHDTEQSGKQSSVQDHKQTTSSNSMSENRETEREPHERKPRSDKGGHHQMNYDDVKDNKASSSEETKEEHVDIQTRLREKWENKSQRNVQRPFSHSGKFSDDDIENTTSNSDHTEEDFFREDDFRGTRQRSDTAKARENFKRKNTEAQDKAEKAKDELDISELFENTPRYTFLWFKYLMELLYADKSKMGSRNTRVDFFDKQIVCDDNILRLCNPTNVVPTWIENSDDIQIIAYKDGVGKNIPGTIVNTTDMSVDIMLKEDADITAYRNCNMFRLKAENNMNFIDSLNTRFLQLPYKDEDNLKDNLPQQIKFIYGPPGTGKTTKLVDELEQIIKSADHKTNVLVLTPTNKAADIIAHKLTKNDVCYNYLSRYGATEDTYLIEDAAVVMTRDNMDMEMYDHNIVVTTMARYSYDTIKPDDDFICDFDWDYIILDEASMIDIVNATFILHQSFNSTFIIAGDPKQIPPTTQNGIDVENIYQMMGINELKAAINNFKRYPLEPLLVQYRSVPIIGNLISDFAYDGLVKAYPQRSPQKPLFLDGLSVNTINFIGFEIREFDPLYGLGAINGSAYHLYSAIFTYNMAGYIAQQIRNRYTDQHYSIGIVSPYGAEAKAIKQMIEERPIGNENCTVTCGTVHSFQGDECDIMFVVMNPPANVSSGSHINKQEILNVAMSRARDYLFFIVPEGQVQGMYQKNRIGCLVENNDRQILYCNNLEKVIFGEEDYIRNHTEITCHQPVNVYYKTSAEYEIRVDDTAMDIKINDI